MKAKLIFIGIGLILIGVVWSLVLTKEIVVCDGFGGDIAKAFDSTFRNKCSYLKVFLYVCYGVAIAGGIITVSGVIKD